MGDQPFEEEDEEEVVEEDYSSILHCFPNEHLN